MSTTTIPQRLVERLRKAADEIETAERLGVPIPAVINVDGFEYGNGVSFAASEHQFAAWADYAEAQLEHYEHDGFPWSLAKGAINELPLTFSVKHLPPAATA